MKSPMLSARRGLVLLSKYSMNQNPTLQLNLELSEINAILAGLQELPGKICNPLDAKIKAQASPQLQAMQSAEQEGVPAE